MALFALVVRFCDQRSSSSSVHPMLSSPFALTAMPCVAFRAVKNSAWFIGLSSSENDKSLESMVTPNSVIKPVGYSPLHWVRVAKRS